VQKTTNTGTGKKNGAISLSHSNCETSKVNFWNSQMQNIQVATVAISTTFCRFFIKLLNQVRGALRAVFCIPPEQEQMRRGTQPRLPKALAALQLKS
jgi:hypothetical protein